MKGYANGSVRVIGETIYNLGKSLCDEEFLNQRPVCFCDIPESSFERHIRHYGKYGLAFEKSFLIQQGANPVFYIAANSLSKRMRHRETDYRPPTSEDPLEAVKAQFAANREPSRPRPRSELLDELAVDLASRLRFGQNAVGEDRSDLHMFSDIGDLVLAYVKCFDDSLPPEDAKNYYMEREWRVRAAAYFRRSDVKAVYVATDDDKQTVLSKFPDVVVKTRTELAEPKITEKPRGCRPGKRTGGTNVQ